MSTAVRDIYDIATAIIDEAGNADFEARTPQLINALMGRCFNVSEEYETGPHSMWTPVKDMSDSVEGIDRTVCLSAMPYGLAALLVLDYDPVKSRSLWSVFLEQLDICRRSPADFEPIADVYGTQDIGQYGRW